jgi:hypothetical protein
MFSDLLDLDDFALNDVLDCFYTDSGKLQKQLSIIKDKLNKRDIKNKLKLLVRIANKVNKTSVSTNATEDLKKMHSILKLNINENIDSPISSNRTIVPAPPVTPINRPKTPTRTPTRPPPETPSNRTIVPAPPVTPINRPRTPRTPTRTHTNITTDSFAESTEKKQKKKGLPSKCVYTVGTLVDNINVFMNKVQLNKDYKGEITSVETAKNGTCMYNIVFIDSNKISQVITTPISDDQFIRISPWNGLNVDLSSYKNEPYLDGGATLLKVIDEIHNIWFDPLKGSKNNKPIPKTGSKLGFFSPGSDIDYIKFEVVGKPDVSNIKSSPLFMTNGLSLFYEIQRITDRSTNYLLKIVNKSSKLSKHMLDYDDNNPPFKNIYKDEYSKFSEYMPKIHYYGKCTLNKPNNKSSVYEYIIYKSYNTITQNFDSITNIKKLAFLKNTLDMLIKFNESNKFITNFDTKNIGWSDNFKMDVKLIDYDYFTLLDFSSDQSLTVNNGDLIIGFWNDVGALMNLTPNYFKVEGTKDKLKDITLKQTNKYDKYAIPGLIKLINKIQVNKPIQYKDRTITNSLDIIQLLRLESYDYDMVSSYDTILAFFKKYEVSFL